MIIETSGFLPFQPGCQNLMELAGINGRVGKREVKEAMRRTGLDLDSRKAVGKYSPGKCWGWRGGYTLMKQIKWIAAIAAIVFVLSGCEEVEHEGTAMPDGGTKIEKNIALEDVYSPSEVSVYSAKLWEGESGHIVDVFLDGEYSKKETWAVGDAFVLDTPGGQKRVYVRDGGMSFYGYKEDEGASGVIFGDDSVNFMDEFPEVPDIGEEYFNSGKICSQILDEGDETFLTAKKQAELYMDKLGMEHYAVAAAAVFGGDSRSKKGCVIYWRQVIDGIPISDVVMNVSVSKDAGRVVYNSRLPYNESMGQADSNLDTEFVDGKLVYFSNESMAVTVQRELKRYSIQSVAEAYKKVEEQYKNIGTSSHMPTLEWAELQYKYARIDGKIYLYPVWAFCVRTETDSGSDVPEEYGGPTVVDWNYYLVDAVTGGFFTDIDTEDLEK